MESHLARRSPDPVAEFRQLLEPGAISAVFQPIVRLADLQAIGYEGLARFPTPPGLVALPPDVTLAAAGRLGVREELEVACWAAISEAGAPPRRPSAERQGTTSANAAGSTVTRSSVSSRACSPGGR